MKEVAKLVLHYNLEDLIEYQTSELKSVFEMYPQAVKDGREEDFDCAITMKKDILICLSMLNEISMSEDDLEKKFETDINLN